MGSMSHWHLIHLWRSNEVLGESGDGVLRVKDREDGRRAGGRRNWRGLEENTFVFPGGESELKKKEKKKNPGWGQEVTYCAQPAEQSNCQLALAPTVSLSESELIVSLPQLPTSPSPCHFFPRHDVPTNRFRCHFTMPEHDCHLYYFFIWKLLDSGESPSLDLAKVGRRETIATRYSHGWLCYSKANCMSININCNTPLTIRRL